MPQKYIKRKTKPVATYGETGEENKIQWITKSVGTFTGGGGGETGTVDTEMSDTSTNAVQNKVIKEYVDTADENLSKVMPTDINVDSNGKLILEHDGVEITGQKKLVDFNSKLDKTGGEINGDLDITGEVTTLTGVTILDESSITFKDTKDTTNLSFINTIYKDNNSNILQISGPVQTNDSLTTKLGILSEGAVYVDDNITGEKDLLIMGDVDLATQGGKTTVYGDALFNQNVTIQGNLSISGTTTTVDTETLKVKDNIIVTNSDKKDLIDLSGIAINISATDTYGIMYNPTFNTVNLGLGTITTEGKFTYNENEGLPLAIRDSNSSFTQDHLISWSTDKNKLTDSGIDKSNVAQINKENTFTKKQILNSGLQLGSVNITEYDIDGTKDLISFNYANKSTKLMLKDNYDGYIATSDNLSKINGQSLVGEDGNKATDISIPVVTASTTAGSTGLSYIKIDDVIYNITDSSKLDKSTAKKVAYVNDADGNPATVEYSLLPGNSNIAQFDTGGHLYTEYPSIDTHAANKKYVDDVVSGISLGIDVINIEYNPDTLAPVGTYDVSVFETAKKRTTKVLLTATGESYGILCDKTLENLDETEPNLMFASGLDEAHNYYVIDMDLRDGSLIIQISKEQGQEVLESGINIKTVNGESLLGSGNITIETIKVVEISDVPAEATNGTLTDEQLTTLQSYDGNYIMFNHEKYYLQDKGHVEGYLTYTHTGYENNQMWLKSITVTIATKTWVLNVVGVKPTVVLTQSEYDALTVKDANTLYYIIG